MFGDHVVFVFMFKQSLIFWARVVVIFVGKISLYVGERVLRDHKIAESGLLGGA